MDIQKVRQDFTSYLKHRYPNDNNVGSTVSMAFFLCNHESDLGLSISDALSSKFDANEYKDCLIDFFITKGRKNPRGDASTYLRSLKLLREYLGLGAETFNYKSIYPQRKEILPSIISVPKPTVEEVKRYLADWETLPSYSVQEKALSLLFHNTYPNNVIIEHVLVKCSVLNDFYGTNIYGIYPIAECIVGLDTDKRLDKGDLSLVDDIANATFRRNYSFATKYCSHHRPDFFPIYDYYVDRVLNYFRKVDSYANFASGSLTDYPTFFSAVEKFRRYYGLDEFNLKEIDQYLWLLGKEFFPKKYGKTNDKLI